MPDLHALFVTTATTEPIENVDAWEHTMGPASHIVFDINGPKRDDFIRARARQQKPDVIFYTGGVAGDGLPSEETFRKLRKIAPSVILQGDMADPPWHPILKAYRQNECFDLYVGMDGVADAPIDHVTLTPLDLAKFALPPRERKFKCGFAGNMVNKDRYELLLRKYGTKDLRSALLHDLGDFVQLRERETAGDYQNYVRFLRRCRLVINTSLAGSGLVHHVKGRVLETAFAGAGLLEMRGAPTERWFPSGTFFTYGDANEAREIIFGTSHREIDERAAAFAAHAREHYTPEKIYGGILERLGLA
jgi:hypothetical protein